MTKSEFKAHLKKGHGFADILNYITCAFIFMFGLYFIFDNEFVESILIGIPLITFSIYALFKILSEYQVNEYISGEALEKKQICIDRYLEDYNIIAHYQDRSLSTYIYDSKFWYKVRLSFYVDENRILYNATAVDMNEKAKGILDFGTSRRATNKIKKMLRQEL